MLRPDQRTLARQVFYDFEGQIQDGFHGMKPEHLTDYYIDRIVEILEMKHPWLERTEYVEAKEG